MQKMPQSQLMASTSAAKSATNATRDATPCDDARRPPMTLMPTCAIATAVINVAMITPSETYLQTDTFQKIFTQISKKKQWVFFIKKYIHADTNSTANEIRS